MTRLFSLTLVMICLQSCQKFSSILASIDSQSFGDDSQSLCEFSDSNLAFRSLSRETVNDTHSNSHTLGQSHTHTGTSDTHNDGIYLCPPPTHHSACKVFQIYRQSRFHSSTTRTHSIALKSPRHHTQCVVDASLDFINQEIVCSPKDNTRGSDATDICEVCDKGVGGV